MSASGPEIAFSKHADVHTRDGKTYNAFTLNTYVVRAVWPDGTIKIRMLARGEAGRRPDLEHDAEFAAAIGKQLEAQSEPVLVEPAA